MKIFSTNQNFTWEEFFFFLQEYPSKICLPLFSLPSCSSLLSLLALDCSCLCVCCTRSPPHLSLSKFVVSISPSFSSTDLKTWKTTNLQIMRMMCSSTSLMSVSLFDNDSLCFSKEYYYFFFLNLENKTIFYLSIQIQSTLTSLIFLYIS